MSLRTKFFVINSILVVVLAALVVGCSLGLYYTIDSYPYTVGRNEGHDARAILTGDAELEEPGGEFQYYKCTTLEEKHQALTSMDYLLVVANSDGSNVRAYGGEHLSSQDLRVLKREASQPVNNRLGMYHGSVIVVEQVSDTLLIAYKPNLDYQSKLSTSLWLFISLGILVGGVLLSVVLWRESRLIFPSIDKLSTAMRNVYDDNYTEPLLLKPRNKNEINNLLWEFEALRRKLDDMTRAKESFDRERGVLISGISHDLRTPLTVIRTSAKGILDGVAERMGKTQTYVERIYDTASSMVVLLDQLSAFAKSQTGGVSYNLMPCDLCEVVSSFVEKMHPTYQLRGLHISLDVPKGARYMVDLDRNQFNRVLQNVADNSTKYKDKPMCSLRISLRDSGEEYILLLSDDGPGIAGYETEYIFESYYRGDPSRTNPVSGSGLGLSIVKGIVVAHHGRLQAYNHNGLTIEIALPYRRKL